MVAKMILPLLGGTPSVWNTSLFFFQALLLGGYAYAHFGSSWLGIKRHAILHSLIAIFCFLALPIKIHPNWFGLNYQDPMRAVIWLLLAAVGLPFFVLAAGTPLLQRWFATRSQSSDPYVLYAASNLGSMVGLVSYPLVVEPYLSLGQQTQFWLYGYIIYLVLTLICAGLAFQPFIRLSDEEVSVIGGSSAADSTFAEPRTACPKA